MLRRVIHWFVKPFAEEFALAIRPEVQAQVDRLRQAALDIPFKVDAEVTKAVAAIGLPADNSGLSDEELAAVVSATDEVVAAAKIEVAPEGTPDGTPEATVDPESPPQPT